MPALELRRIVGEDASKPKKYVFLRENGFNANITFCDERDGTKRVHELEMIAAAALGTTFEGVDHLLTTVGEVKWGSETEK